MTADTYKPEHLKPWEHPDCYVGETWEGYYSAGVGRSRDSDALERANFSAMLSLLGFDGENPPESCYTLRDGGEATRDIIRENHWAVGWVEWIAIHESDTEGLRIADEAMERMANYPVLDEGLYSQLEEEDCASTWECFSERNRVEYLRKHLYKLCGHFRELRAAVKGSWPHAANLLPCPSDILC